jgi:hypothetical protein
MYFFLKALGLRFSDACPCPSPLPHWWIRIGGKSLNAALGGISRAESGRRQEDQENGAGGGGLPSYLMKLTLRLKDEIYELYNRVHDDDNRQAEPA